MLVSVADLEIRGVKVVIQKIKQLIEHGHGSVQVEVRDKKIQMVKPTVYISIA